MRYSTYRDRFYITVGTLVAIVTGFSWNLLIIAFGDVVDLFVTFERHMKTENTTLLSTDLNNTSKVLDTTRDDFLQQVYHYSGALLLLWMANSLCNYLILVLFPLSAQNQIRTIKVLYFRSLLKQDITWFDTNASQDFASRVTT